VFQVFKQALRDFQLGSKQLLELQGKPLKNRQVFVFVLEERVRSHKFLNQLFGDQLLKRLLDFLGSLEAARVGGPEGAARLGHGLQSVLYVQAVEGFLVECLHGSYHI